MCTQRLSLRHTDEVAGAHTQLFLFAALNHGEIQEKSIIISIYIYIYIYIYRHIHTRAGAALVHIADSDQLHSCWTHLVHSQIKGSRCYSYLSDVNKIGTFLPVLPPGAPTHSPPLNMADKVCASGLGNFVSAPSRFKVWKWQHATVAGWNEDSILNEWDVQLAAATSAGKLGASCWTLKEILKPYYSASKWTFSVAQPQINTLDLQDVWILFVCKLLCEQMTFFSLFFCILKNLEQVK